MLAHRWACALAVTGLRRRPPAQLTALALGRGSLVARLCVCSLRAARRMSLPCMCTSLADGLCPASSRPHRKVVSLFKKGMAEYSGPDAPPELQQSYAT